jgi:hypothetical protein
MSSTLPRHARSDFAIGELVVLDNFRGHSWCQQFGLLKRCSVKLRGKKVPLGPDFYAKIQHQSLMACRASIGAALSIVG